jgi:hypothetical protein
MANVVKLTANGIGLAAAAFALEVGQIVSMRGVADAGAALDVTLYISPSATDVSKAQAIVRLKAGAGGLDPGPFLSPYGIEISQNAFLVASFADAGAGHEVWVYVQ